MGGGAGNHDALMTRGGQKSQKSDVVIYVWLLGPNRRNFGGKIDNFLD